MTPIKTRAPIWSCWAAVCISTRFPRSVLVCRAVLRYASSFLRLPCFFFVYLLRRCVTFLPRFSSLPLFPFLPLLLSSSWRLVLSCSRPLSFYPLQIYTPTRRCSRRVSVALMRPRSCYFIARPHAKMCLRYSCELGVSEENELLVCGRA